MSIELDHTVVAAAGTGIAASAKQVGAALDQLRRALDGIGAPWGGDELGSPFGSKYSAVMAQAFTVIGQYGSQLDYAAGELAGTARTLQAHQQLNADRLRKAWQAPSSP